MKKAIVGVAAVSAVLGVGLLGRRAGAAMREHCEQMATQCKEMAVRVGGRGGAAGKA